MPECEEDLTALVESGSYTTGEMAHIIGRSLGSRRNKGTPGEDTYENLILLCPNHHTHIDKAPEGEFPEEALYEWKRCHEASVWPNSPPSKFSSITELKRTVSRLLAQNKAVFDAFGPKSAVAKSDPHSNLQLVWDLRRINTILPNNRAILKIYDANSSLVPEGEIAVWEKFRVHALAYEQHVFAPLDAYPCFPEEFAQTCAI